MFCGVPKGRDCLLSCPLSCDKIRKAGEKKIGSETKEGISVENFRAGIVQMDSQDSVEKNMRAAREAAAYAAAEGVSFLLFPETVEYIGASMGNCAERIPGYVTRTFAGLARKYGMYLHCGSITEAGQNGRAYNTSLVFAPDGQIMAKYRKIHLFDVAMEHGPSYQESSRIAPGTELVTVQTPFACLGLSICYDLRFPELYRLQVLGGAEILCVASNFTKTTGEKHWETLLRARAIENTCYVLAAGQCGQKKAFEAFGHSMAIDPYGEILAQAGTEPQILIVDLDTQRLEQARRELPCLDGRRTEIYHLSGQLRCC